jgi:hypothetical protein
MGKPRKTTETSFSADVWKRQLPNPSEHQYLLIQRARGWYRTYDCLTCQGRYKWSLVVRKHRLVMRIWPSGTYPLSETVKLQYATGRPVRWQLANVYTVHMDNCTLGYAFNFVSDTSSNRILVAGNWHNTHAIYIPSAACWSPPEDEQVLLETGRGP